MAMKSMGINKGKIINHEGSENSQDIAVTAIYKFDSLRNRII
jgi:hypothetical protein